VAFITNYNSILCPAATVRSEANVPSVMYTVVKFSQNGVLQPVSGFPSPDIAIPPAKVVAPPSGQLIFGKIVTIVVTRGQILRLECTKFYFGWC